MNREYDQNKLNKIFGWKTGYYGKYFIKNKKLAPNIAIYTKTPVRFNKTEKLVNVINLIGYAFDSPDQPDYQYFSKKSFSILLNRYIKVWKYAFICANMNNIKKIHVSNVGGGAFSPPNMSGEKFIKKILKPSILKAQKQFSNKKIKLIWDLYPKFIVPNSFENISNKDLKETLYINAWDPWSMVGNGNNGDNSLNGFWGRSSALSALCWTLSNPYIKYISC